MDDEDEVWTSWLKEAYTVWVTERSNASLEDKRQKFALANQYRYYQCQLPLCSSSPEVLNPIDQWCLQHRNKVMVIGISASHPLIKLAVEANSQIASSVAVKFNNSLIRKEVSGKRKRGAVQSHPLETICRISIPSSSDCSIAPSIHDLKACVYGNIIELNDRLEESLNKIQSIPTIRDESLLWLVMVTTRSNRQLQKSLSNLIEKSWIT